ncbi:ATP-dependent Clp protease ATP-binding subunit [Candidatus Uhrbacteria bacterium]|nr:ATP-dependent Clp protease ATP-binding subunit [Candidatus Uhrbacteria bacterium]
MAFWSKRKQEELALTSVFIDGVAYVWDESMGIATRSVVHLRQRARKAGDLLVLAAGLTSFLGFGTYTFFLSDDGRLWSRAFWLETNVPALAFFFAAACGCFLCYRFAHASDGHASLPRRPYGAPIPDVVPLDPSMRKRVSVARVLDYEAGQAVEEAYALAERFGHGNVEPLHLFLGCLGSEQAGIAFGRLGIRFDAMQESVNRHLSELPQAPKTRMGSAGVEVMLAACVQAYAQGRLHVSILEVFQESYRREPYLRELLESREVSPECFDNVVEWLRINERLRERYATFRRAALHKPVGAMNRSMTSVATPLLDQLSLDLTTEAVYGRLPLLVGREREMEEVFRVLEGGMQQVLLVGPPGVGKDALLAGIAERMVEERVPAMLQDKRLVVLSVPALVSGLGPAEAQERLMAVLAEIARGANVILAIPNIEQLAQASGGEGGTDLLVILADALARGIVPVVATTTPEAYADVLEASPAGQSFQRIDVREPDASVAVQILESKSAALENEHGVVFSFEALETAVTLSDRYMHERYLPEKAIEVAREAAIDARKMKGAHTLVRGEDVARILAAKTGIPLTRVDEDERDKLLHLEERMHGRVIGQDEAVRAVAAALRRARAELRNEHRPIANFLFLGPSGVGKTELAKTVAEAYFGDTQALLRFDMSEYQDPASVYRLIGRAGMREGGLLTEAVRRQPFSIVLLDELEKAHPDILNLFLQVMEDGRLTDSAGRTVDFTSAIVIATSNAGTGYIQEAVKVGTPAEQMKTRLFEEELRGVYRPEFLNRFDGIIVFTPLTEDQVLQIAYLLLGQVTERLEAKGIHFRADDTAVAALAHKGYDPLFGARPLRRLIQEEVDNAIAEALLDGKAERRDTLILHSEGKVEIQKAAAL